MSDSLNGEAQLFFAQGAGVGGEFHQMPPTTMGDIGQWWGTNIVSSLFLFPPNFVLGSGGVGGAAWGRFRLGWCPGHLLKY